MIRILIVDDSKTFVTFLDSLFSQEPDMVVVGHAHNGRDGVTLAAELRPDIITMDL